MKKSLRVMSICVAVLCSSLVFAAAPQEGALGERKEAVKGAQQQYQEQHKDAGKEALESRKQEMGGAMEKYQEENRAAHDAMQKGSQAEHGKDAMSDKTGDKMKDSKVKEMKEKGREKADKVKEKKEKKDK